MLQPDVATLRATPLATRTAAIVVNLLDALRRRPQTIEILAWEVVERNALTDTLAAIRERWSREVTELVPLTRPRTGPTSLPWPTCWWPGSSTC